jgi:hypothetical protein
MRLPPHFLDEIRARLSVSQVVGRKVPLKKKGREFAGLSPFKVEKTPSFFVNDQKGFYHFRKRSNASQRRPASRYPKCQRATKRARTIATVFTG